MLNRTLIPDFQSVAMRDEGRPHVLTGQAFAHFPSFGEDGDRPIGLDLSNEMDSASGNRQRIGPVGQLSSSQTPLEFAPLRLRRCHVDQARRRIVLHIPLDKCRADALHLPERAKSYRMLNLLRNAWISISILAIA